MVALCCRQQRLPLNPELLCTPLAAAQARRPDFCSSPTFYHELVDCWRCSIAYCHVLTVPFYACRVSEVLIERHRFEFITPFRKLSENDVTATRSTYPIYEKVAFGVVTARIIAEKV